MAGFLPEHLPMTPEPSAGRTLILAGSRRTPTPHAITTLNICSPAPSTPNSYKRYPKSPLPECWLRPKNKKFGKNKQHCRCDIDATSSTDYQSAEAECKQLVIEAGGTIVDDFVYVGGFYFDLPAGCICPIESGDETALGGRIFVERWVPFGEADIVFGPSSRKSVGNVENGSPQLRFARSFYSTKVTAPPVRHTPSKLQKRRPPEVMEQNGTTFTEKLLSEAIKARRPHSAPLERCIEDDNDWETIAEIRSVYN